MSYDCCEHCDHDPGYEHGDPCLTCECTPPPEYDPDEDEAEAQRIAEVFAEPAPNRTGACDG